jgi:uncharacterized membrane protein
LIGALPVFFVGGQLMLVGPAIRKLGDEQTMRLIARRFDIGSVAALAVVVATGVAMASHFSLWHSDISYGVAVASLLVVWLGVKLTYG